MTTDIIGAPQAAPALTPNEMHPARLIEAAIEKGLDAESMEKLFRLAERYEDRKAERAYAEAMRSCQDEIRPIVRRHENRQTSSKYAKLEDVDAVVRPIYTKFGFSVSFGTEDSPLGADHLRIIADVFHAAGHTRRYQCDLALDNTGMGGKVNKTRVHGSGSTMSYGRRYLTAMIFNVTFGGEDDDGNQGRDLVKVSDEQLANLAALIDEVKGEPELLRWAKIDRVADLPASMYAAAVRALESRRRGA